MNLKSNQAKCKSAKSRRQLAVFTVVTSCAFGQQTFAQQADECLACHTGLPPTANNVIGEEVDEQTVSPACDYSSADLFDGWGWNPITSESCPPMSDGGGSSRPLAESCDYSSAAQFDGWGWDPVTQQSCPPRANNNDDPHAGFPICSATFYDADGDGFGWENQGSCIVTSASAAAPTFNNRQTGNAVSLVRADWNANADIANRVIQCDLYYFDTAANRYQIEPEPFRSGADFNNQVFPSYRFRHLALPLISPFIGRIADVSYVESAGITSTSFRGEATWTTDDGRYIGPSVLQSPYIEQVTRSSGAKGIRTWHLARFDTALNLAQSGNRTRRDGFFECWDVSGGDFSPSGRNASGSTTITNNQCDYSSADQFDGWGWNPVTRESCAPVTTTPDTSTPNTGTGEADACDYSNAAASDGWGWNPISGTSCSPLSGSGNQPQAGGNNVNQTQGCDYGSAAQNGGWGWNGATGMSCPPSLDYSVRRGKVALFSG